MKSTAIKMSPYHQESYASPGVASHIVSIKTIQLWHFRQSKHRQQTNEWAWLCSNDTIITRKAAGKMIMQGLAGHHKAYGFYYKWNGEPMGSLSRRVT